MPRQKPGESRQDYETPEHFLTALKHRLAIDRFILDLAASKENTKAQNFYDEEKNSLVQPWAVKWQGTSETLWTFCNPPYANIAPWVEKAWKESQLGAKVAMLVPASISDWWLRWVDGKAHVLFLSGRLTFKGEKSPYPKDCAVLLYTRSHIGGYEVWDWRNQVPPPPEAPNEL